MATVRGYSFKADTLTVDSTNTTATGKIQWTVPSIPSGATITSCRLTGTVKHVNNVNVYINDELLSNDIDGFTVYLDTSSVVTSVNIKAVTSGNASGTISFSSLAHVLEYEVLEEPEEQLVAEYKFNNTLYDLFPEFNNGFTYTYKDIVDGNVTTRTIYSNSLPTIMRFGNEDTKANSLLEVLYLDTSNIIDMSYMFYKCESLTMIDVSNWDVEHVTSTAWMFANCIRLVSLDLSKWNTTNMLYMNCMFQNCDYLQTIGDVSNWNVSNVTTMQNMFDLCQSLTVLDLSNWNTSKVQNMGAMFGSCYNLTELKTNNWDTSNVTNTSWMFNRNFNLKSLDLSSWNTSKITNMTWMFTDCTGLETLNLNGWNIKNAEYSNMFMPYEYTGCPNLNYISMNNSDYNSVNGIIEQLPQRSTDSYGLLIVTNVDDFSQVNVTAANTKNWNVKLYKVAEYKFDNTLYDLFPEFNEGFAYTYEDVVEGDVTTRTIYASKDRAINIENDNSNPAPEVINDIMQYSCSEWEVATIDLSEYAGKNVDISFTITAKTETWCQFEINNKIGSYETICDIWEPDSAIKIFDYNTTIENIPNDFKLILGGMNGIVSNINIIVEGENLFPSKLIAEHYLYGNMNCYSTTPVLHDDNTLEFTNHWRGLYVNIQDYRNMNLNVSFDIKGIRNDITWSEFEYGFFNHNEQNYDMIEDRIFYTTLTEESSYHVEFDAMVTESTHFYLGGMGGYIENLKILVDNDLPTLMRFGAETTSNRTLSLLEVLYLNTDNLTNAFNMFNNCINLIRVNTDNWNTSGVTSMAMMFNNCIGLTELNVNNWNLQNTTTIWRMFNNCNNLITINGLADWNTNNICDVSEAFKNCSQIKELDLSKWDVSNVTDMSNMFRNCQMLSSIGNINNWDTSNVTTMQSMFHDCFSLMTLNLSHWDTSNVTTMQYMFYNAIYLNNLDISNWMINVTVVVTDIFGLCENLNNILMNNSDYNSVNKIISQLPTRTADSIGTLDITDVDDMSQVDINAAKSKNWNIIGLPQIKVVEYKFTNSSDLVPVFNEGFVYTYEDIVDGTTTIRTIYGTELPTSISFTGQTRLMEVNYIDTSNLTSTYDLFYNCTNLTYVDFRNSDFSKVETIERMFAFCSNLIKIDGLNDIDVSNINNMGGLFTDCPKIPELDVKDWDVSKVTNFGAVFRRCTALSKIDVSKWNTSSGVIMSGIFTNCSNLTEIDIYNWDTTNANSVSQMFYGCSKLKLIKSFNHIGPNTVTTYLFGKCTSLQHVQLPDSDVYTINKVIEELPTRNATDPGILDILGADIIDQVNKASAKNKYWNIIAIHNAIKKVHIGNRPISTLSQQNKKIKNIYFGDNKLY